MHASLLELGSKQILASDMLESTYHKCFSEKLTLMYLGELIEYGSIFNNPEKELTHNYVRGHFG